MGFTNDKTLCTLHAVFEGHMFGPYKAGDSMCCHKFSFSRSWTTQKQWKTILHLSCIFVKFSADLADHISPTISNKCIFFGAFVYVYPLPFSALRRCVTSQESTIANAHANAHAHADAASLNASANASAATNTIEKCSPSLSWSAVQSSVLFAWRLEDFSWTISPKSVPRRVRGNGSQNAYILGESEV